MLFFKHKELEAVRKVVVSTIARLLGGEKHAPTFIAKVYDSL